MMELKSVKGFDREQWTTVQVHRLKKGDVFRFPNDESDSVVSTAPFPYEDDGAAWVEFATRNARTGVREGKSIFRRTTSVLVRCDVTAVF
ncbi:hypothetical protein [Streptomyces sp. NPDC002666]